MFTCRRCLCKNCKCDGCNCNNKRELIVKRKYCIFWLIGGLKRKEISRKICDLYKLDLLSVEDLLETEKENENSIYGNQIKSLEEKGKPIDEAIIANLLAQFVKLKQRDDMVGYLIESSPNLQQIIAFERAVGTINLIFYIHSSLKELRTECEEQAKNEIRSQRSKKSEEDKGDADVGEEIIKKCNCIKKKTTHDDMATVKLKKINMNIEDIKSSCYKEIFKNIKGGMDLEKLFKKVCDIIDKFFNPNSPESPELPNDNKKE